MLAKLLNRIILNLARSLKLAHLVVNCGNLEEISVHLKAILLVYLLLNLF